MTEIRWHGRGGQGAKTAALLLADALISKGKWALAFPEYGPERMGAPVVAFNRIDEKPISIYYQIINPDVVIVLDSSLIEVVDVTAGLKDGGILLINSNQENIRGKYKIKKSIRIFKIDATGISMKYLKRNLPNTPLLGALIKILNLLSLDEILEDTRKKFEGKFKSRPEVIENNLKAIEEGYNSVKEEEVSE